MVGSRDDWSALYLACRLLHAHGDRQRLRGAAVVHAADRRRAEIIEADRDPDMRVGRANAVGDVERDPAQARHMGLGPGVARVLIGATVAVADIAADAARRNPGGARGSNEGVGEILIGHMRGAASGARGGAHLHLAAILSLHLAAVVLRLEM